MRIVADINQPLLDEYFGDFAQLHKLPTEGINNKELKEFGADALICRSTVKVDKELLNGTNVKYVGTCTIGYDHVDRDYLQREHIGFGSAPGCNAVSVSEYVFAAIIKIALKHNMELSSKTLGVVGVGNVGREVVKRAQALGMKVLLNDPPRARNEGAEGFCSIKELLKNSDFVSLHVPLIKDGIDRTLAMAGKEFFAEIKPGAVFINACRGKVAYDKEIINALDSQKILEAVIDVFQTEPNISHELVEKAFIATEHISGHSIDGKVNGTKFIYNSLVDYFSLENDKNSNNIGSGIVGEIHLPNKYDGLKGIEYAIDKCYNIMADSDQLKTNPNRFAELRKNYRKRYEFSHYLVSGSNENLLNILCKLGFNRA